MMLLDTTLTNGGASAKSSGVRTGFIADLHYRSNSRMLVAIIRVDFGCAFELHGMCEHSLSCQRDTATFIPDFAPQHQPIVVGM